MKYVVCGLHPEPKLDPAKHNYFRPSKKFPDTLVGGHATLACNLNAATAMDSHNEEQS